MQKYLNSSFIIKYIILQVGDSKGDLLTIHTGQKNFEKAGLIAKWNNESTLSYLEAPCNRLEGASDGKKFGNNVAPNQTLYFYHKALCRAVSLVSQCCLYIFTYI